jgi:hypothetical protein
MFLDKSPNRRVAKLRTDISHTVIQHPRYLAPLRLAAIREVTESGSLRTPASFGRTAPKSKKTEQQLQQLGSP